MTIRKRKLLIVDDEPATRVLLSRIFTGMGLEVASAADGFAALRQMRKTVPDIILSDLNMPGMSGFELLSVVRRRLPEIFVIATSGAYTGSAVPQGIPADAFYEKATGLAALFKIMERVEAGSILLRDTEGPTPIWISVDKRQTPVDGYLPIACPECLRIFAYALASSTGMIHKDKCIFCRSEIHYAIVEVLAPVSERAYHMVLDAQMDAQASTARQTIAAG